ncbi:hypothetical protein BC834DRAFT_531233 [Gloeopeniophorella convolvens]|nr:hypothetical protein BC834DRAFT_531233 [Gloeopeniophorella convolvens]
MSAHLLAAVTAASTQGPVVTANNLRIASLSIAVYDYLWTLPAEYRFYRGAGSSSRFSLALVLFALIRYTSILVLVVSNVGFFYHHFTSAVCKHYYLAAPVCKVIQTMASQAILGVRTYNISRRHVWVGRVVLSGYIIVVIFEWFSNLYDRIPNITAGNCGVASAHPDNRVSVWSFYLVAMLYDLLTLSISTFCLMKLRATTSATSQLLKIMLYDGLGYFVALTGVNILNLILYRGSNASIQSAGASLGYAVTWIMSQRILIHLREAGVEQTRVVVTELQTSRAVASALRFEGETKYEARLDREHMPAVREEGDSTHDNDFDVQVRVERSVVVDVRQLDRETSIDREVYTAPKSIWDRGMGV